MKNILIVLFLILLKKCASLYFRDKNKDKNNEYYRRALEIIRDGKCTNIPEVYSDDYHFLRAGRLAAKNYGLKYNKNTKFCKNCLDFIKSTSDTVKFVKNQNIKVIQQFKNQKQKPKNKKNNC
jgi:hypothetical protein